MPLFQVLVEDLGALLDQFNGETKCVNLTHEESLNVTAPGLQNHQ
jgi:hypothetical protein